MKKETINKLKTISIKIFLTVPVILFGFYQTFIQPVLKFLGERKTFQPLVKLWNK